MKHIQLVSGDCTMVDPQVYEYLNQYVWRKSTHGYAYRTERNENGSQKVYMHREIIGAPEGSFVDHINGNGLDNRQSNLRACSNQQNQRNARKLIPASSQFKGVSYQKSSGKWTARITIDRKTKYLGSFESEQDAAYAYDCAANELFGEYARANFN